MKTSHLAAIVGLLLAAAPVAAQYKSASEELLTAVKEANSAKVVELVNSSGSAIINTRGYDGSTALTLAVKAKDSQFVDYLLTRGANPDMTGIGNEPSLVIAARLGWNEGVDHLLQMKARVDATNRQGETALIVAVQARSVDTVRRLLQAGANPDRADSSAGMSARDYAKRDARARDILAMIQRAKPAVATKP